MLFNSIEFLLFLVVVFILYWFVFNWKLRVQNLLVLVSSYIFYGWWDYRFLFLIFLSTIVDYFIGLSIVKCDNQVKRKYLLLLSVLFNLGVLGFFKYYNFFVDSWVDLLASIGYVSESTWVLNIVLPVGISFYTFQTMSYTIDMYRGKLEPTKDFISFATFVAFFPQLVAGPIERATNLLPQIRNKRKFNYEQGVQGLRLILWGMFKKIIIADSLAPLADNIFDNYQDFGGGTLFLGAIFFAFQIYCDFSGYSDIAIGTSKLFGFELMSNFKFPYFSRNIGEFWRRWHISLSTWFRDYLYIPLGGSRNGDWQSLRNIFIIFLVSGFWHGANFTFIVWGLIHAILYIPSFIFKTNRKYTTTVIAENSWLPSIKELIQVISTFFFVTIAWVFFRSQDISSALEYISLMRHLDVPDLDVKIIILLALFISIEFVFRKDERSVLQTQNRFLNAAIYGAVFIYVSLNFISTAENGFIYFQF